jgi:Anti-sigma-K factor rskA
MNRTENYMRFEELSAGRAMGDLSLEESAELQVLGVELGLADDHELELLAAAIEVDFLNGIVDPMPAHLLARLERHADSFAEPANIIPLTPAPRPFTRLLQSPLTGWAAAAAVALMATFSSHPRLATPAQAELKLRAEANDLIEQKFTGLGSFKDAGGTLIWSDQRQQGYMTLTGIPANDSTKSQYQLWIVDPKRDEAPVDGGVFDISTDNSPTVVPIVAKLALSNPQAFVITMEQPGGVVKSKQERLVALAKR